MKEEGPPLETLVRRLADCPNDFLAEPRIGPAGVVSVPAVVADLLRDLGGLSFSAPQAAPFHSTQDVTESDVKSKIRCVRVSLGTPSTAVCRSEAFFQGLSYAKLRGAAEIV